MKKEIIILLIIVIIGFTFDRDKPPAVVRHIHPHKHLVLEHCPLNDVHVLLQYPGEHLDLAESVGHNEVAAVALAGFLSLVPLPVRRVQLHPAHL